MFSRRALAHLLGNPVYAGKVTHKGAIYDGQHDAIVDELLWEQVQSKLAEQRNGDHPVRSPKRSLLVGLVYDGEGRKMTPTHTSKSGERYRYYVTHQNAMVGTDAPAAWRISAPELERVVTDRLKHWLRDRREVIDLAGTNAAASAIETAQRQATALADPLARMALVAELIARIDITPDEITINITRAAALTMLGLASDESAQAIVLTCHAQRIRQGKDVRMIVADDKARGADTINRPLVSLSAEAHELQRALVDAPEHTIASLADTLGKCRKRSAKLLRIAHLAPDIVERCIAGTQPASLTTKALFNMDLPIGWREQRIMLGVS